MSDIDDLMDKIDQDMPGCAWALNRHFKEVGTCAASLTGQSGEFTFCIGASPVEAMTEAFRQHKEQRRYATDYAPGVLDEA